MTVIYGTDTGDITRPLIADNTGRLELAHFNDSQNLDPFGLLRTTGGSGNRFDVEFIYDKQTDLVDEVTAGGGDATHSANTRDVVLAVNDANDATEAALYGYDVPYTPGSGQKIEVTGALDNAGIGGGTAFVFVRTSTSGSAVETTYAQTAWNKNAVSDVDWSLSQIFRIDFQSLRVGRIRFALVRNGLPVTVHEVYNDNVRTAGFWQYPSLPLYWRIYNDATYTYAEIGYGDTANAIGFRYRMTANASATMRAICGTVKSEGGESLFELSGYNRSADRGVTGLTVSTTLLPVISIRPAATYNSIANRGLYIPTGYGVQTSQNIRYALILNPTLTDPSWTAVGSSGMEYDVTASAISGGTVEESDYLAASTAANVSQNRGGLLGRTLLTLGRTANADILTLAAIRTGGSDASVFASLKWKEIR